MVRKIVYWTSTAIVAVMLLFCFELSYRQSAGGLRLHEGRIPAAPQDNSWDCQTSCRNRPAVAGVCFAEGMGLRGRGFRVGDGGSRPLLSGRRRASMEHTTGAAGPSDRLLRDQACEPQTGSPSHKFSAFLSQFPGSLPAAIPAPQEIQVRFGPCSLRKKGPISSARALVAIRIAE